MLLSKIADYKNSISYDYFVFTDEGRLQIDIVNYRPYDRTDGLIYRKQNWNMTKKRKAHVLSQLNGKSLAVNYRKTVEQIEAELLACHSHRRYEYLTSTLFLLLLESDSPITSVIDFKEGYTTYTRKGKEWRIDHSWQLEELLDEFLVNRTFGSRFLEKLLTLAKEVPTTSNFQPSESYKSLIGAIRMSRDTAFYLKGNTSTETNMLPYLVLDHRGWLATAVSIYSEVSESSVLSYDPIEPVDLGQNLAKLATSDAHEFCKYMTTNDDRVISTKVTSVMWDEHDQPYVGAEIYRTDERARYYIYLEAVKETLNKRTENAMQPVKTNRNSACYTIASDLFGTFTFSNSIRSEADHDVETATPVFKDGEYYLSWHTTAALLQSGLLTSMSQGELVLILIKLKDIYDKQGYLPYLKQLRAVTGICIY